MKNLMGMMIVAAAVIGVSVLSGCSSVPRNRLTDPTYRIAVDPTGLEAKHYVRIVQALRKSNKFIVVDRGQGFDSIVKEQNLEHVQMSDRFKDTEKYALWARILGIGSVIIGHTDCIVKDGWFKHAYVRCHQFLSAIDARTGEVLSSSEADSEGNSYDYAELAPSWQDATDDLVNNFPKNYEDNHEHEILRNYHEVAGEEALRMKEKQARQQEQLARDLAGKKGDL